MANDLVVKNNALIDASYTLSLVEQRLIGLALVKANNQHQEITSDTVLTIHAGEYAEQFKVDGSVAYRALKEASERLFLRYFSYTLYGLEFARNTLLNVPKAKRLRYTNRYEITMGTKDRLYRIRGFITLPTYQ